MWVAVDKVVEGSVRVEATNLAVVVVLEALKEIAEEVVDLDDGLIGNGRQVDLDGR